MDGLIQKAKGGGKAKGKKGGAKGGYKSAGVSPWDQPTQWETSEWDQTSAWDQPSQKTATGIDPSMAQAIGDAVVKSLLGGGAGLESILGSALGSALGGGGGWESGWESGGGKGKAAKGKVAGKVGKVSQVKEEEPKGKGKDKGKDKGKGKDISISKGKGKGKDRGKNNPQHHPMFPNGKTHENAKTKLTGMYIVINGRSATKADIDYTVEDVGDSFQATVTITHEGGSPQAFAGEIAPGSDDKARKQAEQNAAEQAVFALDALYQEKLPYHVSKKDKKRAETQQHVAEKRARLEM